jgi:hypothetical protein
MPPSLSRKRLKLLLPLAGVFTFLLLSIPTGKAAEIALTRQELAGSTPHISVIALIISGQIVNGDAKKVEALLSERKRTDEIHTIRRLLIHSPGGLVGEAMEIGRLVRKNDFEVFIPKQLTCISACVLILAGGTTRTVVGQVGLHHPLFLRNPGPGDDVPALMSETKKMIREYLSSMGIADNLADAMFSVPDGNVRFLSQDELFRYGLTESN